MTKYQAATTEAYLALLKDRVQEEVECKLADEESFLRLFIHEEMGKEFFDAFDKSKKITFEQVHDICGVKAYVRLMTSTLGENDEKIASRATNALKQDTDAKHEYKPPVGAGYQFNTTLQKILQKQ